MAELLLKLLDGCYARMDLFLKILNMSLSATWLVLAVLLARLVLKKAPKWVDVLLWGLVGLRLICPFTLESALSLLPSAQVIPSDIMMSHSPAIDTGVGAIDSTVNPIISGSFTPDLAASANPLQILLPVLMLVWGIGMAAMGIYTLFSYWRIRRKVRMAIRVTDDLYLSEFVDSPFILGLWKPRIYLPYHMAEPDRQYVVAHERAHLRRRDHWWKPLGFLLLTIHWFNPILWAAYILLCRDIELACDERVIRDMGSEQRADYSQALLNCSVRRAHIAACPLAFGEVGVKERVKNVLHYKKPAFWIVLAAVLLCAVVAVCFLTNPSSNLAEKIGQEQGYRVLWEMDAAPMELVVPKLNRSAQSLAEGDLRGGLCTSFSEVPGSHIFLKHAESRDVYQEYVNLTFGFDYAERQQHGQILTTRAIGKEGIFYSSLGFTEVSDGNGTVYPEACYFSGVGPDEFSIALKAEVWDQAEESVSFHIEGLRTLFYHKNGPFQDDTPYPITQNLPYEFDEAHIVLQGGRKTNLPLTRNDLIRLKDAWYALTPKDFQPGTVSDPQTVVTLRYGSREMTLSLDGAVVQFTFDEQTAKALGQPSWCVRDPELRSCLSRLTSLQNGNDFGIYLDISDVSPTGATVIFSLDSAMEGDWYTGHSYMLETKVGEYWQDVPMLQDEIVTTEGLSIDSGDRWRINWENSYGTLPAGNYRIGKPVATVSNYFNGTLLVPEQLSGVVYAEFTIADPNTSPYDVLHGLEAEGAGASADFLAGGGGYNFFPDETAELVGILSSLEPENFIPSAALEAKTLIHVQKNNLSLTLQDDGSQIALAIGDGAAAWTVDSPELQAFVQKINGYSQAESTYEIYNVAPLEELNRHYNMEEASIDKVVVMADDDLRDNGDVWEEFVAGANAGQSAWVRCMQVHDEGTTIFDLSFDGRQYTIRRLDNGIITQQVYGYLKPFRGLPSTGDYPEQYTYTADYYVLVDDPNVTWQQLMESALSSQSGVAIPFALVYTDRIATPILPTPGDGTVTPDMLTQITYAELNWYDRVAITDSAMLKRLSEILSQAQIDPGIGCPLGNVLTMTLGDGTQVEIELASDSCGVWASNGVYYSFSGGNEELYSLFAAPIVHTQIYDGAEDFPSVLAYLNWSYYERLYGMEETLALMDHLRDWALEDPSLARIGNMLFYTEGLDGAYSAYYANILNKLYEANPADFSWACLGNAPENKRDTVVSLLALARGISESQATALMRGQIPN